MQLHKLVRWWTCRKFARIWLGVAGALWLFAGVWPTQVQAATTASQPLGNPIYAVMKLFLSLIVIVVLAIVFIRFLARKTQVRQTGSIRVLAAQQIAPNRFVQVVDVAGKRYLLGVGTDVQLLADVTQEFSADFADDKPQAASRDFAGQLSEALFAARQKYRLEKGKRGPESDKEGSD
ncbi:flagellar biosynthetic protein FliO [Alicyclobacillus tolerans]|uniref:FliO/MopB family protein n=1 Tax=Alicyclobacillus tolerans TaxID=90970 RepID=UPI001F475988|nr:flagellar biosynthetic protein FliO [Alicyclobacillus tolerans]MCF8564766.1 flagellar biosynthetic protein FliO [Alicyclobacillus tolerans]